jgi:hypothetical protein
MWVAAPQQVTWVRQGHTTKVRKGEVGLAWEIQFLSREQQRCGQTDEPVEVIVVGRRKSRAEGGWMKPCAVGHVMDHVVPPRDSFSSEVPAVAKFKPWLRPAEDDWAARLMGFIHD